MQLKSTQTASHQQDNLDELRRQAELESLRYFVKDACCFVPSADPETATIGMDELKKLCRSWKLHERRNFWKNHPNVTSLVTVLLQFIEDTGKTVRTTFEPTPPADRQPSRSTKMGGTKPMRQIYGLNYFNRDVTDKELALHSRFFSFPVDKEDNQRDLNIIEEPSHQHQRITWAESRAKVATKLSMLSMLNSAVTEESHEAKRAKHLNLAEHLVNFSSSHRCDAANLPVTAIPTFTHVAETTDELTATVALIALSNIASMKHVRDYMLESNLMRKVQGALQNSLGPSAAMASALFFYYFSIDPEAEDRVFNVGGGCIASNGLTDDRQLQKISMKTMVNLLPCGDRLRVSEMLMRVLHLFVDQSTDPSTFTGENFDREMAMVYLPLLQSVACFYNTHSTLHSSGIFDLLAKVSIYAKNSNDIEVARLTSEILLTFLDQQEHHMAHMVSREDDYIFAFEKLLEIRDDQVLETCMIAIAIMSGVIHMQAAVNDGEVLAVVAHTVFTLDELPAKVSYYVATFYCNLSQSSNKDYLRRLVFEDRVALSVMALISKSGESFAAQQVAVRCLQNLLTEESNCDDLCEPVLPVLMRLLELHHDLGAAEAIYNISCCNSCVPKLKASNVHINLLKFYMSAEDQRVRQVFLETLCQMFIESDVIDDLIKGGMVERFSETVRGPDTAALWPVVVKIALNIVDHCDTLTEKQRVQIVGLLDVVCVKSSSDSIIGQASVVLAYLSLTLEDFTEVDSVLRSIISLSSSDLVTESVSITIYNLTCSEHNASLLLRDSIYIHIMIKIMRNGRPETQINIAKAVRTLCSKENCVNLMMKDSSLSDLIVIALLRTSSPEIKVVCTEAFFNMLTHYSPREQLLTGDLWWAVTRICRNDDTNIRVAAAKALLHLSIDAENCKAMRRNHIFSFVMELSVGQDAGFVDVCMQAIQNLGEQFTKCYDERKEQLFKPFEFIQLVKICTDALARSTNIETVQGAIAMLVNIAVQGVKGWDQSFHEDVDLLDALIGSASVWGKDATARQYMAELMWNLSNSALIVKQFSLADWNPVMSAIYCSKPTESECENLLGLLANYVTMFEGEGHDATMRQILDVNVTYDMIFDAFGVGLHHSRPHSIMCRTFATTVLAYVVAEMDKTKLSSKIVSGIVTSAHMHVASMRDNLMVVIHELSKSSQPSAFLLDADIFSVLLEMVQEMKTTNEFTMKYMTCCMRNISSHCTLVPFVVRCKDLDVLVKQVAEMSLQEDVCFDISCMLFYAQDYKLENSNVINSEFTLEMCGRITEVWSDGSHQISKICKLIIGEVLEKYSTDIFVDPTYVQSMYQEMTRGDSNHVTETMRAMEPRALPMTATFALSVMKAKVGHELAYLPTPYVDDQWQPYLVLERRRMITSMLDRSINKPSQHQSIIVTENRAHNSWSKIEEEYPRLRLPGPDEVIKYFNTTIKEEGEENEDEEGEKNEDEEGEKSGEAEEKSYYREA